MHIFFISEAIIKSNFLFSFGKILEENEALLLIILFLSSFFSSEVLLDHMFFVSVCRMSC